MLIYLLLMFTIVILFLLIKDKKKALLISFFMMAIIASLRKYTVGVDTGSYIQFFNLVKIDQSWDYHNFGYEPGFYYLCKLLSVISMDPQILIACSSCFICYSYYKFVKNNSNNYFLSTILFIIMNFFFLNMNIMRQAIALSVLLFAYDFLKEKKYIKYLLCVFLATTIHTGAIASVLLLLFYILPEKKVTYIFEVICAVFSFVFYNQFFNIITLGFKYKGYSETVWGQSNYFGALLSAIEALFVILMIYIVSKRRKMTTSNKNEKIIYISIILYLWFSFLAIKMTIFNRISSLFSVFMLVYIPNQLKKAKEKKEFDYRIMLIICFCIYIGSFFFISKYRPEWYGAVPYQFFWQ